VFLSHGGIVTAAIFMTVVEGYRPTWKSLGRTLLYMNIYMGIVGLINYLIGSNYLFIAHKPETASLIDVLGPWPWYLLALEGIGLVLFTLLYVPFAIRDLTNHRMVSSETT
ncbi:MAG: TIGR02206 family membrane protein, partial [Anaerolineaceae bacterium]|nr:TIGR02206 family membrane protein [Anaerolineaceae bacterium]